MQTGQYSVLTDPEHLLFKNKMPERVFFLSSRQLFESQLRGTLGSHPTVGRADSRGCGTQEPVL